MEQALISPAYCDSKQSFRSTGDYYVPDLEVTTNKTARAGLYAIFERALNSPLSFLKGSNYVEPIDILDSIADYYSNHALHADDLLRIPHFINVYGNRVKIKVDFRSAYNVLFKSYESAIKDSSYQPTIYQRRTLISMLGLLSNRHETQADKLDIKVSADEELLVLREIPKGIKYIIVGKDKDELFYGYVGKKPGDFDSLQWSR